MPRVVAPVAHEQRIFARRLDGAFGGVRNRGVVVLTAPHAQLAVDAAPALTFDATTLRWQTRTT